MTIRTFAFCALLSILVYHHPATAEVWLAGLDPVTRAVHKDGGLSDFLDLFSSHAPWEKAAAKVTVLKVSAQFLIRSADDDLAKVFAGLKARNIALGVELGMLSGDGTCGRNVEGYSAPGTPAMLANRVRHLGGDLAYVAMDEQLWFGKYGRSPRACHTPIPAIAREIADSALQLRRIFPNIKIGDIEPIGATGSIPWMAELKEWMQAYRLATGFNLAFLHVDVNWNSDWQLPVKTIAAEAAANGIPFGVIINSDHPETTDIAWTMHAEERLAAVRSLLGSTPSQIIFQSWTVNPTHFLPEDQAGTLTNLVVHFGD
jgi:hypothetical protein